MKAAALLVLSLAMALYPLAASQASCAMSASMTAPCVNAQCADSGCAGERPDPATGAGHACASACVLACAGAAVPPPTAETLITFTPSSAFPAVDSPPLVWAASLDPPVPR